MGRLDSRLKYSRSQRKTLTKREWGKAGLDHVTVGTNHLRITAYLYLIQPLLTWGRYFNNRLRVNTIVKEIRK